MAKPKSADNQKVTIQAELRTVLGKQVKQLRKQGLLPANVYGPDFESKSVTVQLKDFVAVYKVAHETGIVYVNVGKDSYPTLIKQMQHHPVTEDLLHVDFRKIDLKQKMETDVPVVVEGESEAVNHHGGVLLTQNDHITVEALPSDIPSEIRIDISVLKEIGQEITVADLQKSDKYVVVTDPEAVLVSVTAHKEESVEPETTSTAPEVITEKAPAEGAEASADEDKKE